MISDKLYDEIKKNAMDKEYKYCDISQDKTDFENNKEVDKFLGLCSVFNCLSVLQEYLDDERNLDDLINNNFNASKYKPLVIPESLHVSTIAKYLSNYIIDNDYKYNNINFINNSLYSEMKIKNIIDNNKYIIQYLKVNYPSVDCDKFDFEVEDSDNISLYISSSDYIAKISSRIIDMSDKNSQNYKLNPVLVGHFMESVMYYLMCNYIYGDFKIEMKKEIEKDYNNGFKYDWNYFLLLPNINQQDIFKLNIIKKFITKLFIQEINKQNGKDEKITYYIYQGLLDTVDEIIDKTLIRNKDQAKEYILELVKFIYEIHIILEGEEGKEKKEQEDNIFVILKNYIKYIITVSINNMLSKLEEDKHIKFVEINKKIDLTKLFIHAEADYFLYYKRLNENGEIENDKIEYLITDSKCYKQINNYNMLSFICQLTGYKHQYEILKAIGKVSNDEIFGGYLIIDPVEENNNFVYCVCGNNYKESIHEFDEIYNNYIDKCVEFKDCSNNNLIITN